MADGEEEGGGGKRLDWTTWDELLLACAVERHGSKDWDLVALELQARSSLPLTAQTCKAKFIDLDRRFMNDGNAVARSYESSVPWIEDLRKLRVAELQQEVHRRDLSIQKLQLKVKRLEEEEEEEREKEELKDDDEKPDLKDASNENNKNETAAVVLEQTSPSTAVGDGENLSFNESNSSREDEPNLVTSESKPTVEDSSNDSSDTIAKQQHAPPSSKANQAEKSGNSAEFPESAATNSKKGNKDSSDVQSSASLSKKKRRLGNEPVVSPATMMKRTAAATSVKSEPLVEFLDFIRSHKYSSFFERRLQNQKSEEYSVIIRQHIDLETIRKRLAAKSSSSHYASDATKFYRDLLLLFTNFITFFPKSSKESSAAQQLRSLVLKEIISNKMTHVHSNNDSDVECTKKRPPSAPIVVCRKRSSISGKSKEDDQDSIIPIAKEMKSSSSNKEKPVSTVRGTRSLRKGIKSRAANKPPAPAASPPPVIPSSPEEKKRGGEREREQKQQLQQKMTISTTTTTTNSSSRKRGAADFLKRIKKNTSPVTTKGGSSSSSSLLERLRSDEANASNNNSNRKSDRRKELPKKRGVGNKQSSTKEDSPPPPPPPPPKKPANGKSQPPVRRGKEVAAAKGGVTTKKRREESDTPPPAKKRTRR